MIKDLKAGDPVSVGPYRLLGRLGAGGMGMVYLAKSPGGRLVAIKLIRPELAEEKGFRARFAGEIAAARNVSGIYTAAVVDADSDAELPWMATVYVPGPSLTDAVEDSGPLPVESVLALAAGLAEALEAIHRAGLVHRDLKPSNVLLASDGPRVIDFGISRALEGAMMTTTGMVLGSPGFMSPEQAMGEQVGQPSDVFSLGAILAFASTGNSPFGTGPTPALLYRVVKEQPDLTQVPAQVRPMIEQCLAKDPASRPTPADLLASLSDDVAAMTGEWLPPTIADAMGRYSPTLSTPLPPPFREPDSVAPGTAGAVGAGAAVAGAATAGAALAGAAAADATGSPAAGPPAPPVPADATVVDHGLMPATSLVAVTGGQGRAGVTGGQDRARATGGQGIPGGAGPAPGAAFGPPGPRRRRRWPVLVAAVALVVIAAVAALALTRSPGKAKVGPVATASLAGDATRAATAAPTASKTPTRKPSPTATGYTQDAQPSSAGGYTSSPTATASWTPTPTASRSATPTSSPTPTATTSATPTSTPTSTTPTSSPTLSSPTAAVAPPTSTP